MTRSVPMLPREDKWHGAQWPPSQGQHPWQVLPNQHHRIVQQQPMMRQEMSQPQAYLHDDSEGSAVNSARPTRAQQACASCRQKKTKCTEARPTCAQCQMSNTKCIYNNENIPTKRQLSFMDITERLDRIQDDMALYKDDFASCLRIFEGIKPALLRLETIMASGPQDMRRQLSSPSRPSTRSSNHADSGFKSTLQRSIPYDHSTPAHKLVTYWASIKPFYRTVGEEDYVLPGEQARTIITTLYRAQQSKARTAAAGSMPVTQNVSFATVMDSDSQSSTSSVGLANDTFMSYSSSTSPGGRVLDPISSGREAFAVPSGLGLTQSEARVVFQEYLHQIHILHPIIDAPKIENIINSFVIESPDESTPMQRQISCNSSRSLSDRRNLKRKLSPAHDEFSPVSHPTVCCNNGGPADTAVALLVVALGRLCRSTNFSPTPAMRPESTAYPPDSAISSFYSPYYAHDSFAQSWTSHGTAGRSFGNFGQPHDLMDAPPFNVPQPAEAYTDDVDAEAFPGIRFYVQATQMLGELFGESDLAYVHALLLAGIYCGLLVRPLESSRWINTAATTMQGILKSNKHAMTPNQTDPYLDSIRLTFWTCLQLESDLLAELDLPQSGISRYESQVPFPTGPIHHGSLFNSATEMREVMWYYSQQIYLRRLLNRTHSTLYGSDSATAASPQEDLPSQLDLWCKSLITHKPTLAWSDNDMPPERISDARMRGKYYGAKYIIHRPCLQRAMTRLDNLSESGMSPFPHEAKMNQIQGYAAVRDWLEVSEQDALEIGAILGIDKETMRGCRQCVNAAIRSTEVFDGLPTMPRRLHVTNVFGTAQAQFSNMLVLAAVARSQYLFWLIPGFVFKRLLDRTMTFISSLAPFSPTMATNLEVLREVDNLTINGAGIAASQNSECTIKVADM